MSGIEITAADTEMVYAFARTGHAKGTSSFEPLAALFAQHRIAARNAALEEVRPLIEALADDLEAEMKDRYCLGDGTPHPVMKRKYDRDMAPVNEARSFLTSTQDTPDMRATNKGDE